MLGVVCIVLSLLVSRSQCFNHWVVTEEGKIEYQLISPFNLRQPFDLLAFIQQEERVSILKELKEELIEYRNEFENLDDFDSYASSFRASDTECRKVKPLSAYDLFVSTVLPLKHKGISFLEHLDLLSRDVPGEPFCLGSSLDFSMYALEHLDGVQDRRFLASPPEKSVLASVDMKMEMFGSLVHHALEKNMTSWVLLDLASLYWRARGNPYNAIECIRRALHYSPIHSIDIALLNLANVLHRSQRSNDAIVPLKTAISTAPNINVLHYTLGNVYATLGLLNNSVDSYERSLLLEPNSIMVQSVYKASLCELRVLSASHAHSRKLEDTQKKLDQFYEFMDLVKRNQLVSIDGIVGRDENENKSTKDTKKKTLADVKSTVSNVTDNRTTGIVLEHKLDNASLTRNASKETSVPPEGGPEKESKPRKKRSKLCLVLTQDNESDEGCIQTPLIVDTNQDRQSLTLPQQCPAAPNPFSTFSTATCDCSTRSIRTCKKQSGKQTSDKKDHFISELEGNLSDAIDCALGTSDADECQNDAVPQTTRETSHETPEDKGQHRPRIIITPNDGTCSDDNDEKSPQKTNKIVAVTHSSSSDDSYPEAYRVMEFLPYNPLPAQLEEVIFPVRSSPLASYDDPFWPSKSECLELVASLKNMQSAMGFTGTFLTPEARGADIQKLFAPIPATLPSFMQKRPRCTDIVELPYSMAAMDHLEPMMYRTTLRVNEQGGERGLQKVLTEVVSSGLDRAVNFNESAERTYASMLKNGPNWALFNLASLYWRATGDPHNAIECLRRAVHFSPNEAKDVGYIGLANVLHRQGFLSEAVIVARAALDITGDSPVGHYTLAGIYLSLRDYIATSLHLRAALHAQSQFEYALSALKLVRCSLKFKEEHEYLKRKMRAAQEELVKQQEALIAKDLEKMLERPEKPQITRTLPIITEPSIGKLTDSLPLEPTVHSPFTGEDAIRYLTKLSLAERGKKSSREREREREKEREVTSEDEVSTEDVPLGDVGSQSDSSESSKAEPDDSSNDHNESDWSESSKVEPNDSSNDHNESDRSESSDAEEVEDTANQADVHNLADNSPDNGDTTKDVPLDEDTTSKATYHDSNPLHDDESIQLRDKDKMGDPKEPDESIPLRDKEGEEPQENIEDRHKHVETDDSDQELLDGDLKSKPNTRSKKPKSSRGDRASKTDKGSKTSVKSSPSASKSTNQNTNEDFLPEEELEKYLSDTAKVINENKSPVQRRVQAKMIRNHEAIRDEEIQKRFPGYRPWPKIDECHEKPPQKYIVFTSTWLSVTAKGINISEHIDFTSKLEHYPILPYCHTKFESSPKTLEHLKGMSGPQLSKEYKAEKGLQEVLCNLEGSHRSLEEMATRLKLAMDKNSTSWVLSNLAALYWRIMGQGLLALKCLKHALYYSHDGVKDVTLVSLANVLYRLGYEKDATAVMQISLETSPSLVVNHFTMANILAAQGFMAEAGGFYESTLHFQPEFQPGAERLRTVRCLILIAREKQELQRLAREKQEN